MGIAGLVRGTDYPLSLPDFNLALFAYRYLLYIFFACKFECTYISEEATR